ncbi:MAG: response regulator [Candidatus Gastranaerophilales bacterium]|nr:response regulator [Candidatus Gastranaerophilales bacterium]MCM1072788.1 response regulator [Bacteroides sp.]
MFKKMKILIVDDIEGWREYHKKIVSEIFEEAEIVLAESAREGYDKLMEYNNAPFDIIITDLQMESDFEPQYAGEWFIEQIKGFKAYLNTKVVIISGAYNIKHIAEVNGVECIPKPTAYNFPQAYEILKNPL